MCVIASMISCIYSLYIFCFFYTSVHISPLRRQITQFNTLLSSLSLRTLLHWISILRSIPSNNVFPGFFIDTFRTLVVWSLVDPVEPAVLGSLVCSAPGIRCHSLVTPARAVESAPFHLLVSAGPPVRPTPPHTLGSEHWIVFPFRARFSDQFVHCLVPYDPDVCVHPRGVGYVPRSQSLCMSVHKVLSIPDRAGGPWKG